MNKEDIAYLVIALSTIVVLGPLVFAFHGINAAIWTSFIAFLAVSFLYCEVMDRRIMKALERED